MAHSTASVEQLHVDGDRCERVDNASDFRSFASAQPALSKMGESDGGQLHGLREHLPALTGVVTVYLFRMRRSSKTLRRRGTRPTRRRGWRLALDGPERGIRSGRSRWWAGSGFGIRHVDERPDWRFFRPRGSSTFRRRRKCCSRGRSGRPVRVCTRHTRTVCVKVRLERVRDGSVARSRRERRRRLKRPILAVPPRLLVRRRGRQPCPIEIATVERDPAQLGVERLVRRVFQQLLQKLFAQCSPSRSVDSSDSAPEQGVHYTECVVSLDKVPNRESRAEGNRLAWSVVGRSQLGSLIAIAVELEGARHPVSRARQNARGKRTCGVLLRPCRGSDPCRQGCAFCPKYRNHPYRCRTCSRSRCQGENLQRLPEMNRN